MLTKQKHALITGATSGIGYELAKLFAEDGYNLFILARHEEELQRTAAELKQQFNVSVETIAIDLFNPENAFNICNQLKSQNKQIDVLVNNAGQGEYGEFVDTDINREIDIIQLNITSLVVLTKQFLKEMVQRGEGKILNVASVASKLPGPWQSVYHGTKAFVYSFTEAIREEVREKGIVVTSLLPGATNTDFFNKANMLESKVVQEGKLDDPAKVAKDGYDALMNNNDRVISGLKNKVQLGMSNIMPDDALAKQMYKQQEPVTEEKK